MGPLKVADLPEGRLLGLDTVTLIYFLERHPAWFPLVRELFQGIENNRFSAVISSLVFAELLVPAYRADKPDERQDFSTFSAISPTSKSSHSPRP